MSSSPQYSHTTTVAAITSYYKFLSNIHSDEVSELEYPPSTGWPQITPNSFAALKKTDTVIELLRHIPYFVFSSNLCIMPDTPTISYIDTQTVEFISSQSEKLRDVNINDDNEEEQGDDEDDDAEEHPSKTKDKEISHHIITLTASEPESYTILLDTIRGVIILSSPSGDWSPSIQAAIDAPSYASLLGLEEDEIDESSSEAWKRMPTFKIDTFFEMCKNQFRECHWMPRLEELGRGGVVDCGGAPSEEGEVGRMNILKGAGWPGDEDGEGGGWDRGRAQREMEELFD